MTVNHSLSELNTPDRLSRGLVIVLPGIEGRGYLNRSIARGLAMGGVDYGIEIYDWTYGPPWQLWSLRSRRRHTEQATLIAAKIAAYQNEYPKRPVHLVGHSGGGAMIAYTLETLEAGRKITSGVMLVPALSPKYPMRQAVSRTERGIWNFCSHGDLLFLGIGTLLCGTTEGRHCISAGNVGFSKHVVQESIVSNQAQLRNVPYQWQMLKTGHWGGHLSVAIPQFVASHVAPLICHSKNLDLSTGDTVRA